MQSRTHELLLEHYARAHSERRAANFDWSMGHKLFAGVDLEGKTMLDVGCGGGYKGMWAATHGVRRVVGLEPEVEGSNAGMQDTFRSTARAVGLEDKVELAPVRLQDYAPGDESFDIVLLAASINHLDEDACVRLQEDEEARETYRAHLRILAAVARPSAILIVTDCDRRNVFARLGIPNPVARTIEWEKHQSPMLWAQLLTDVGFEAPTVDWLALNPLRELGQALMGNRVCAYFMKSAFRLTMRRGSEPRA